MYSYLTDYLRVTKRWNTRPLMNIFIEGKGTEQIDNCTITSSATVRQPSNLLTIENKVWY